MSKSILEGVYDLSYSGCLIVFPGLLNRHNVVSLIVSGWERYNVAVVTDNPEALSNVLGDSSRLFFITDYSRAPLGNSELDIILFDSIKSLSKTVSQLRPMESRIRPRVIVLSTWGDSVEELQEIVGKFGDLSLLALTMVRTPFLSKWEVIKISESREGKRGIPEKNNTLERNGSDNLSASNDKFSVVLDGVNSNWPEKQLVITKDQEILPLLNLSSQKYKTPYEIENIHSPDSYDEFNNSPSSVLVVEEIPRELRGVSVVHIIQDYSANLLYRLMDSMIDRKPLAVYFYLTEGIEEEVEYNTFLSSIKIISETHNTLLKQGNEISFDPSMGLTV